MAKKRGLYEPIDEDVIRNLIGGVDAPPRLVPKEKPAAVPQEVSPPETPPPKSHAQDTTDGKVQKKQDHKEASVEYQQTYLQYRKYDARITCRLDCEIRRKLSLMIQLFGGKDMSVTCLINNIIYNHLEEHRNEINTLIENTTKNMKL